MGQLTHSFSVFENMYLFKQYNINIAKKQCLRTTEIGISLATVELGSHETFQNWRKTQSDLAGTLLICFSTAPILSNQLLAKEEPNPTHQDLEHLF